MSVAILTKPELGSRVRKRMKFVLTCIICLSFFSQGCSGGSSPSSQRWMKGNCRSCIRTSRTMKWISFW